MTQICLYHSSDLDGLCSGAIYAASHKDQPHTLYPIDYGDDFPWDKAVGADVTIIDWSLQPFPEWYRLLTTAGTVTWIDHHKSAIDPWRNHEASPDWCKFQQVTSTELAGCELAWKHFFPDQPIPTGVYLLGRYDVWDHEDDRVLPFQYGMRLHDLDPANGEERILWDDVLSWPNSQVDRAFLAGMLEKGHILLRYETQNNAAAVAKAWFTIDFAGGPWQACNRLGKGSQFFDSVWNREQYAGMLAFGYNGKRWPVGLYCDRPGFDCGAIAKLYGGGGHPGAAGFISDELPFVLPFGTED